MGWEDLLRPINAMGCAVAMWFLASAAFRQWKSWNNKTQAHWWALFGWVFLGLEGAIEAMVLDTTPGPRVVIQTLVVAWTLRAMAIHEELKADPAVPWKEKP